MRTLQIPVNILLNGNMSGALTSQSMPLTQAYGYSIQANYTGSPAGTIKLQCSLDNINFVDIEDTTFTLSGAGSTVWNVSDSNYPYVQCVWSGGGTGTLNVIFFYRGF